MKYDVTDERDRKGLMLDRESAQYILDHNDGFYKIGEVGRARTFLTDTEQLAAQAKEIDSMLEMGF